MSCHDRVSAVSARCCCCRCSVGGETEKQLRALTARVRRSRFLLSHLGEASSREEHVHSSATFSSQYGSQKDTEEGARDNSGASQDAKSERYA
jgi:hypothetical protein